MIEETSVRAGYRRWSARGFILAMTVALVLMSAPGRILGQEPSPPAPDPVQPQPEQQNPDQPQEPPKAEGAPQNPAETEAPAEVPRDERAEKQAESKVEARPAVIWHQTVDMPALNLFYGAGGKEDAPIPGAKYKFKKEDTSGTNPKFDVEDDHGVKWKVKLGPEPRAETASTRLLFAAGYFVDEDYYIEDLKVAGLPKLKRGSSYVSGEETVHGARLERRMKEIKKLGNWSWFKNPFVGTKEFDGLRVMMALVNNWDLKDVNNTIHQGEFQLEYAVTDVGATFGKTGNTAKRSKSVLKDFEGSKFVDKKKGEYVDFVMHSRPLFITALDVPNYEKRTHMQDVTKHIPRAHAKWLGQRLSQLTPEQIRDCFRAGGYSQEEIEGYSRVIQKRIAELNAL